MLVASFSVGPESMDFEIVGFANGCTVFEGACGSRPGET